MFGKLLKHEFLTTWRLLATVVGIIIGVCVTLLIPAWLHLPVIGSTGQVLSLFGFAVIGPVVVVLLAIGYWRTMYSGPGYFTHSLPVRGRAIFGAKVTYAVVVSMVALASGLGLAMILPGRADAATWEAATAAWRQISSVVAVGQMWAIVVVIVVMYACELVLYLSAMTLGTRGVFGSLGPGGSVMGLVIAYFVVQIVVVMTLLVVPLGVGLTGPDAGRVVFQAMDFDFVNGTAPSVLGVGWLPALVVLAAVAAGLAVRSVEHHTNLA